MLKMRVGDISFLEIVKQNAIYVGEGITYYLTEIIFICVFAGTWCICICICGQYSICQWCGLPRVLSDLSQNWFSRCSHCCCCHHCHHCHHCFCPGHRHHQNCYHIHRSHDSHHHHHNYSSHLLLSIKSTQSDQQLQQWIRYSASRRHFMATKVNMGTSVVFNVIFVWKIVD